MPLGGFGDSILFIRAGVGGLATGLDKGSSKHPGYPWKQAYASLGPVQPVTLTCSQPASHVQHAEAQHISRIGVDSR